MIQRVRAAAGGTPVGSAWTFPLRTDRDGVFNIELQSDPPAPYRVRTARVRVVSPGFFEAMGIKSLAGRVLTAVDRTEGQRVAVVNRAFVHEFFPGTDPLRGAFAYGGTRVDRTAMIQVVGVVENVRYRSLAEEEEPTCYVPQAQAFASTTLPLKVCRQHREWSGRPRTTGKTSPYERSPLAMCR